MKKLLFILLCLLTCGVLQAEVIDNPIVTAAIQNDIKGVETLIKNGADVNEITSYGEPVLCDVIWRTDTDDIIKLLVDNGADVNAKCRFIAGSTPLHYLLFNGKNLNNKSLNMIKYLVEKGANVNAQDERGSTPLFYAGTKEIAKYLVDNGADVNKVNNILLYRLDNIKLFSYFFPLVKNVDKNKLLHQAVRRENFKIVKLLVKNGADVNSVDEKNTPLIDKTMNKKIAKYLISKGVKINNVYQAIVSGKTKLAKEFINKENYSNEEIERIFYYAVYCGDIEIAKLLIDRGMNVNIKSKCQNNCECETTPLHIAVGGGNLKMVKFLVNNGADVNAKASGISPLYSAAKKNNAKIMKYLIEKGADINTLDNHNLSVFFHICNDCKKEAIEILLKNKAEIAPEVNGNNSIVELIALASEEYNKCPVKKKEQILKMMIKYGVDINSESNNNNALERAMWNKLFDVEKILVKLGAKSDEAIRYNALHGNKEMIEFLLKHGFDINEKDRYGETVIDYPYITEDMVQFLISHGAKSNMDIFDHIQRNHKGMVKFLVNNGIDINTQDNYGHTILDYAQTDEMKQFLISHGAKSGKELKESSKQESK